MKYIITESQSVKVTTYLNKLFDQKLTPAQGWEDVVNLIEYNSAITQKVESVVITEESYYFYFSCDDVRKWELEDTECPCLMLQGDYYYFFDKRFPPDLWKPLLVDWWNERCMYRVKSVYKY